MSVAEVTLCFSRSYFAMYSDLIPKDLLKMVNLYSNCEDLLMNFLVAHVTKLPPIKGILFKYR